MGKKRSAVVTDEAIGALLRERRHARGLSQAEVGAVIDVGEMQIQKYETGQSALSVVKLVKLAEKLGCKTPLDLIP
jgi:transcriptional regulator with XRE-family HTH domain